MSYPTTCAKWIGWNRPPGGTWVVVASGSSLAEAERELSHLGLVGELLALPDGQTPWNRLRTGNPRVDR